MIISITPVMHHLKTSLQPIPSDPFDFYGSLSLPWGGGCLSRNFVPDGLHRRQYRVQSPARLRQVLTTFITIVVVIVAWTVATRNNIRASQSTRNSRLASRDRCVLRGIVVHDCLRRPVLRVVLFGRILASSIVVGAPLRVRCRCIGDLSVTPIVLALLCQAYVSALIARPFGVRITALICAN